MGPIDATDVFLDIGSGIGNVIAQIALTTNVRSRVGLEVRPELCAVSETRSRNHLAAFPHLRKLHVVAVDARDAALSSRSPMREATLVFANSFLFEEETKLVVARELCEMPRVRVVAASCLFCPRHRARCTQPFCARWTYIRKVEVPCSWKSSLHGIFLYKQNF